MKTIKFGNVVYDLVCDVVRDGSRIRATIYKNDLTLADVAPTVSGVNEIQVLDGEEVVTIYTGYTLPVSLNIYKNYPLTGDLFGQVISIELENVNFQAQIDALNRQFDNMAATQETQDTAISDLGEAVNGLADSQETQDLAIEDLAEAVSELTPEEE